MARITVEDCLKVVDNRFELVLMATRRARQLENGVEATINPENDKPTVLALREIADRSIERLGRSDVGVARMRRLFERELKAISEGRPTKDWVYSGEPAVQGF